MNFIDLSKEDRLDILPDFVNAPPKATHNFDITH